MAGGGAERVTSLLLHGTGGDFAEDEVHLVLLDREEIRYAIPPNVEMHQLDGRHQLSRSVLGLYRLLKRLSPDIVVSALERSNVCNVVCRALLGYRAVLCEHTYTSAHFGAGTGIAGWLKRLVVKFTYRHADRIVAVSDGIRNDLADNFGVAREKLIVIHNPVDIDAIAARSDNRKPIETPERYVVSVGRLVPLKNFALLIEAVARIPGLHLVILGEGPERRRLEQAAARADASDRIHLPGYTANPYPVIAGAMAFVSSSNIEGFPMALLEAMALGRPVVATDCPTGPAEILSPDPTDQALSGVRGEYGMLVPMNAPDALAEAIRRMADPDVGDAYAAKARERVRSFSAGIAYRRYAETISSVLAGGSR